MEIISNQKTNWKYISILVILAVIVGGLSFLFFVGFSRVSTNKEVYEIGEEIAVSFSDFRLFRCTSGPNLNFYHKTSGGWSKITHTTPITFGRSFCVDGKLVSGAFPPDVVSCCILCKPFLSGKYIWPSQIYEKKPEKEICGEVEEPIDSYELKPAPPGKYKIEFGRAKKTFEIKGMMPSKKIEEETTNWSTYSNSVYNVEFKYPSDWQLKEEVAYAHKYEGSDGFFQISAVSGKDLTIDEVCGNEAHHKLEPYGSQPKIEKLMVQNKEACLILPSDDQPETMKNQTALIVQYPQPIQVSGESYNYFILWADQDHINEIVKTLKFILDETTDWKTYRNEEYGFEIKSPEVEGISFFKITVDAEREFLFGTLVCMEGEESTVLGKIKLSPHIEVDASLFEELGRKPTEEECDKWANRYIISGRFCTDKNLTKYQAYCEEGAETPDYHRYDVFLVCEGEGFKGKEGRIRCNQIFNQMLSTFRFIEEIRIGKVEIDYEEIKRIQQSVDEGHQPWRLNPVMVVMSEAWRYGFTEEDIKTIYAPHIDPQWVLGKDITALPVEITHKGKKYEIMVIQPFPGEGKIWTISEIKLKE